MAGPIDSKDLVAFRVYYGFAPTNLPKAMTVDVDFTFANPQTLDFTLEQMNDRIEFFQAVYIDNSKNAFPLSLTCGPTQQTITCPSNSQGYFPILATNPPRFSVALGGAAVNADTLLIFLTMPVPAAVWKVV